MGLARVVLDRLDQMLIGACRVLDPMELDVEVKHGAEILRGDGVRMEPLNLGHALGDAARCGERRAERRIGFQQLPHLVDFADFSRRQLRNDGPLVRHADDEAEILELRKDFPNSGGGLLRRACRT